MDRLFTENENLSPWHTSEHTPERARDIIPPLATLRHKSQTDLTVK